MEQDKYISLGDSYIEIEGDENDVSQFIDDILKGQIKMELSTKSSPKTPVKIPKKNLKFILTKLNYSFKYKKSTVRS